MAGFTMPKRGSGAAMLRDLRDEERPPLEEGPEPGNESEPAPIQTPLAETLPISTAPEKFTQSEIDALEAEMHLRTDDPSVHPSNLMTSHMTDNMTDNMTSNIPASMTGKQTDWKTVKQPGKTDTKKTGSSASKLASRADGQKEGPSGRQSEEQSVADMIRQRAARRGEPEVLKTVTLKLSPTLDEKVERYCFDHKMKKQEFWADAAALYFEMIAGDGEE